MTKIDNFYSISFNILSSNHLLIPIKINDVNGNFIIDTGASNSCVNYSLASKFKMDLEFFNETASSATENINKIFISKNNKINIGEWKIKSFELMLFDLSHVTELIYSKDLINIDGIIGSDILIKANSKIDFQEMKLKLKL